MSLLLKYEFSTALEALTAAINVDGNPRGLVALAILDARQQQRFLGELPLAMTKSYDAAVLILGLCDQDRWNASPSWLESVLTYVNVQTQSQVLQDVIDRMKAKQVPTSTAFDRTWLTRIPFFDRTLLRPLVKKLVTTLDLPVLRVNGPAGCGCSYTARALEEIAEIYSQNVTVLTAEVPSGESKVYHLEDLVGELFTSVPGVLPVRSASSYPTQMVRHTLNTAASQGQLMIFVIDGADGPHVHEEIKLYVSGLAKAICTLANRRRARLVLINHRQKLGVLPIDLRDEPVPHASALRPIDLAHCLQEMETVRVAEGRGKVAAPITDLVAQLLAEAPTAPKDRLEYFNERLLALYAS